MFELGLRYLLLGVVFWVKLILIIFIYVVISSCFRGTVNSLLMDRGSVRGCGGAWNGEDL